MSLRCKQSCQQTGTLGKTVMLLLAGGKNPPSITAKQATARDGSGPLIPGQLRCWSSAPRTQAHSCFPNMARLERWECSRQGCRQRTGKSFDQVENKSLPTPPFFPSRSKKEMLQKAGLHIITIKIAQLVLNKVLPLIAFPCASLSLFRSLSFHFSEGRRRSAQCRTTGTQQVGQARYGTSRDCSACES